MIVARVVVAGLRLHNPLNQRQHWQVVWRRGVKEKDRARLALEATGMGVTRPSAERPWTVTVTRCGPGKLDAHDALPASAKHVVDAVAEWLGVDDKHANVVAYRYAQRREREWSVEVEVDDGR